MALTHTILREVPPPKRFTRHLPYHHGERQDNWHRGLEADGEMYCGDFMCNGSCGLPKLVRKRPAPELPEGYVVEQASALLGIEAVWSGYRWRPDSWEGPVVLTEYTDDVPMWY